MLNEKNDLRLFIHKVVPFKSSVFYIQNSTFLGICMILYEIYTLKNNYLELNDFVIVIDEVPFLQFKLLVFSFLEKWSLKFKIRIGFHFL